MERHGKRVTLHFGEALEEVPFHRAKQQTNTSLVVEVQNLWHFGDFWGHYFGGKILGDNFKLWWMNWGGGGLVVFFGLKMGSSS